MRFLLFPCLLLLLLLSVSCFIIGPAPTPTPVRLSSLNPLEDPAGPAASRAMPIPLTREAVELRRIRDEHAALIASIPPTPGPTPTLTVVDRSLVASARVRHYPDGVPVPPRVGEDWFDPGVGLEFYRDSGDDWTSRSVRESHSHRDLFYFSEYPDSIPNFFDRSIYHYLSRELVFESVLLLPLLGEPTPAMVSSFSRKLGWELRDSPEPVINLWTTFTVRRDGAFHTYAVGGVMLMGVSSSGDGETLMEYVTLGTWRGPVVVERLTVDGLRMRGSRECRVGFHVPIKEATGLNASSIQLSVEEEAVCLGTYRNSRMTAWNLGFLSLNYFDGCNEC